MPQMACGWFSVTGWWTLLRQHLPSLAGCLRSTCADDADWKHLHYFFCLHGALSGGQVGQVTQTNLIVCVPWGLWNKEHFFLLLENWIINSHTINQFVFKRHTFLSRLFFECSSYSCGGFRWLITQTCSSFTVSPEHSKLMTKIQNKTE